MKLAVVGHSLIHIRQQKFFQLLADQEGMDVTLFCPGEWRDLRTEDRDEGNFHVRTLKHFGGEDVYRFKLLGLKDAVGEYVPDILYVQQEPNSVLALEISELPCKKALFTWENIADRVTPLSREVLPKYDLVVCGNDDAEALVKPHNRNAVILPQVGVDTAHMCGRPGVPRSIKVAHIGRATREKGVEKLMVVWPTAFVLPWTDYLEMPWKYAQVQIVICYSQDVSWWREQAMPYVAMEAISSGAYAVVSDGGSIPFWHHDFAGICPGSSVVPQNDTSLLRKEIEYWLENPEVREKKVAEGRQWAEENLSSPVIARRLVECLEKL